MLSHLANVAHQPLRSGVYWVEHHKLCNTRASCCCQLRRLQSKLGQVPAPNTLALLDSLLYTFADEFVPAAASATFATASLGDGVIVLQCEEDDF